MREKMKFENVLKEFNFEQFYELCRIFEVDVVDRQSVREALKDATNSNEKIDFSDVKMRRDFDNLEKELIEKYYGFNRAFRRQVDKIIEKVVKANRAAAKLQSKYLETQYKAGIEGLDKVTELHNQNVEANTEVSTSNAAVPSEVV